jgi:hypothetical protein
MVDFTQNPLENAQSLLQETRQNRRRQERNDTTGMLFNLAGQVIGNVMQGRQEEKYNRFMNQESVLGERSIVRSAVDKAQKVAERGKLASSYEGGKEAYFLNELTQLYTAKLNTNLSKDNKYYDQADVGKLAQKMAAESVGDYINAFDEQLGYAQSVLTTTGGDRLAYAKSLRDASGVDLGVMGRGMRKLTSYFLDEDDRNTDGALYRSVTSSEIYRTSKEFQENFDKYYTKTGSALVSDRVAQWESDPKNKEMLRKAALNSEIESLDLGDGLGAISRLVFRAPNGSFAGYSEIDESMNLGSPETAIGNKGRKMGVDMAATYIQEIVSVADQDTTASLNTMIENRKTGNSSIDKAFTKTLGNTLSFYEQGMYNSYDTSVIPEARLKSIVARAIAIDAKEHENSLRLSKGNEAEGRITDNPVLTYMAAVEEYEDVDDIPEEFRVQINRRVQEYVAQDLPGSASPARVEEAIDFVGRVGGVGGSDFADFEIGKLPVLEALELARAQATVRLQFKNQKLAEKLPENMTFPEYLRTNKDAQAEIQAMLRKTSQQKASDAQAEFLAGPRARPFIQYSGI